MQIEFVINPDEHNEETARCECDCGAIIIPMRKLPCLCFICPSCGLKVKLQAVTVPGPWYVPSFAPEQGHPVHDHPELPLCLVCDSSMYRRTGTIRHKCHWIRFVCEKNASHCIEAYNVPISDDKWAQLMGGARQSMGDLVLAGLLAHLGPDQLKPELLRGQQTVLTVNLSEAEIDGWLGRLDYLEACGLIHDLSVEGDRITYFHSDEFLDRIIAAVSSGSTEQRL